MRWKYLGIFFAALTVFDIYMGYDFKAGVSLICCTVAFATDDILSRLLP